MTPATANDLIDALRDAQVLTPAQAEATRAQFDQALSARVLADELQQNGLITAFQADQVLQGYAHELVVGHYRLLDVLGEGGMGFVFKARDPRLNRTVALKVIRADLVNSQANSGHDHTDAVRRFHREAEAVAQLMHPNVVVLYERGEAAGVGHYLAMEYVEGIDLARLVQQQGVLPIPQACEYVRQAALGLQCAHDHGVVHRDIKPSNLLVTRPKGHRSGIRRLGAVASDTPVPGPPGRAGAGVVKILDMGLAQLGQGDERSRLTEAGSIIGTPDFIAPEQATDASKVDHRADLYSLGCTFYFLLTGQPPYPDGSPVEKLTKHTSPRFTPRPAEEVRRNLPPDVARVLYRMMAKNPDNRYQHAADVAEDLADVQFRLFSGMAGAAPAVAPAADADVSRPRSAVFTPPPPPTAAFALDSVVLPVRRSAVLSGHKGFVSALTFSPDGRLLASAGADEVLRLWDLGPMLAQAGALPVEAGTLRNRLDVVQAIAFDPTGGVVITGSANTKDGPMWLWDWREKDPVKGRQQVPGQPIQVDALAFSRDGQRLAASVQSAVFVWSLSKKGLTRDAILRGHGTTARALAFSADGKRLVLGGEDTTVRVYEFGWFRNALKATLAGHNDAVTAMDVSPAGDLLATGSRDGKVVLWDATEFAAAPVAVLQGHTAGVRTVRFTPKANQLVSVGDRGQVILWDVRTRAQVREWITDKSRAYSVVLSPDGRYVATGSATDDGLVSLYDLELIMIEQLAPTAAGVV